MNRKVLTVGLVFVLVFSTVYIQERGWAASSLTYHTTETILQMYKDLSNRHSRMSYETIGSSVLGEPILLFKIGNPNGGTLLFDGRMHGAEDAGTEGGYLFAKWILESSDYEAKKILEENYVLIIPVVNVDSYYRPNERSVYIQPDGSKFYCNGVNLNRNFVSGFGDSGLDDPSDLYDYRGLYAASEPETQAVRYAMAKYSPDIYVNFHDGLQSIMYDDDSRSSSVTSRVIENYDVLMNNPQYSSIGRPHRGGWGGFAIGDGASFGASSWLVEVARDMPSSYNDFISQIYTRKMFPLLISMCRAIGDSSSSVPPSSSVPMEEPDGSIIDDVFAVLNGDWFSSSQTSGYFGSDYKYHMSGDGQAKATWSYDFPQSGSYEVYARWTSGSNRASDAPYTVNYAGGSRTVDVNQRVNGGEWNSLGVFYFRSGVSSVSLSNQANGIVIADAVMMTIIDDFEPASASTDVIVDNNEASVVGAWISTATSSEYYGNNYLYRVGGYGANTVTWRFGVSQPGSYEVYARWTSGSNRASDAPYTVNYAGRSRTVDVNQRVNGGEWVSLGVFYFTEGMSSIILSDDADGVVIADAIRLVSSDASPSPTEAIVMDDVEADYVGNWPASSLTSGSYGGEYKYRWAGMGANTATWSVSIPEVGSWEVYARWTSSSNRATDAPYTVYHAYGSSVVTRNQEINGGVWISLGTFDFKVGITSIMLSDDANDVVIADGIKLVKIV